MALKGLDIFKLSPRTNCRDCGFSTCMAFSMKVAQGGCELDKCPHFSQEAKQFLLRQSAPPMHTITVGAHRLGGETVLFRHEKTLVNRNRYAVNLHTDMDAAAVEETLAQVTGIGYERIGERMYVEFLQVDCRTADAAAYANLVRRAAATGRCLILRCRNADTARAALNCCGKDVILCGATAQNWAQMGSLAQEFGVPLGVWGKDLPELYDTVKKLESRGLRDLLLDVTGETPKQTFASAVQVRRAALAGGDRTMGYPSIVDISALAPGDRHLQTAFASLFTPKYGSLLVMQSLSMAQALPLFGLRQNIYTDPQKPMKVAAGIYPLNGADGTSPCALTVDFALTYFLVRGELEKAGQPVNLIIGDTSGMSVLTAWAAGKLSAASISRTIRDLDVENRIQNRTLIIPGKVAVMNEEIRQVLPGWRVVAGPAEAAHLPAFMANREYETATGDAAPAVSAGQTREVPFDELLHTRVPRIETVDMGVRYKARHPDSRAFFTIGERIHCISPAIREAMDRRDPGPILKRAAEQIAAGATCLDVNIGPAEKDGPERMMWAVRLLQENFDAVPLALDTANRRAIEAGIHVYDRRNGKPIINSADAGDRISVIDLAAANGAICIALCSAGGLPGDNEERLRHCQTMLEKGLSLGMSSDDLWFDPLFLVVKGMQDKQPEVLEAIRLLSGQGLKTTGGVSNNSNGAPKPVRPVMDAALMAMAMAMGLTSAIINPCDERMMQTIKTCDIFRNRVLYSDSYLEL